MLRQCDRLFLFLLLLLWCSPPPKMKKTCGENEKLPTRRFINLGGTGITEFDNPVKPALNLYLIGR